MAIFKRLRRLRRPCCTASRAGATAPVDPAQHAAFINLHLVLEFEVVFLVDSSQLNVCSSSSLRGGGPTRCGAPPEGGGLSGQAAAAARSSGEADARGVRAAVACCFGGLFLASSESRQCSTEAPPSVDSALQLKTSVGRDRVRNRRVWRPTPLNSNGSRGESVPNRATVGRRDPMGGGRE